LRYHASMISFSFSSLIASPLSRETPAKKDKGDTGDTDLRVFFLLARMWKKSQYHGHRSSPSPLVSPDSPKSIQNHPFWVCLSGKPFSISFPPKSRLLKICSPLLLAHSV